MYLLVNDWPPYFQRAWALPLIVYFATGACGRIGFDGLGGASTEDAAPAENDSAQAEQDGGVPPLLAGCPGVPWDAAFVVIPFDDQSLSATVTSALNVVSGEPDGRCVESGGGCATIGVGRAGKGMSLTGDSALRVDLHDREFGDSGITVSMWAYIVDGNNHTYVAKGISGPETSFLVRKTTGTTIQLYHEAAEGSGSDNTSQLGTSEQWHHIVVRWSGTAGDLNLMVDGNPGITSSEVTLLWDAQTDLTFGVNLSSGFASGYARGSIDELLIFDRWLSDAELAAVRNCADRAGS